MLDARALIEKHRGKGVFVDANLLVLLLVGRINRARIRSFKRTQNYDEVDFEMLSGLIRWFGEPLVATPHILSQVSDLTDLSGAELRAVREEFKRVVETVEEQHDPARQLVEHRLFSRFGLGDASIAAVCEKNVVVLTTDLQLQIALAASGLDAINFNHLRPMGLAF